MNRAERRKAGSTGKREPLGVKMENRGSDVVIEFHTKIKWFSLGLSEAEEFLVKLQKHVDQLKMSALSAERSNDE